MSQIGWKCDNIKEMVMRSLSIENKYIIYNTDIDSECTYGMLVSHMINQILEGKYNKMHVGFLSQNTNIKDKIPKNLKEAGIVYHQDGIESIFLPESNTHIWLKDKIGHYSLDYAYVELKNNSYPIVDDWSKDGSCLGFTPKYIIGCYNDLSVLKEINSDDISIIDEKDGNFVNLELKK